MFKKMKVVSVTAKAWNVAEAPSSKTVTAKDFSQLDGGRVVVTGYLMDENDKIQDERTEIVMQASQLGPVKAAFFNCLKRGEGILEADFQNPRYEDGEIEYQNQRVDISLTAEDGSAAFKFHPAPKPNWVNVKEFGEVEATPVLYSTTQEKKDAGREKLSAMIKASKRG
jgi:hypothetical protein